MSFSARRFVEFNLTGVNTTDAEPPCTNLEGRVWLVLTNIALLLPLAYLGIRVRPFPTVEFTLVLIPFFGSSFYHLCENDSLCGAVCIFSVMALYAIDVLSVNQLIVAILVYSVELSRVDFKIVTHVLYLMTAAVLFVYVSEPDMYQLIILAVVATVIVLGIHTLYRIRDHTIRHFIKHHIQRVPAVLFFLFGGSGLTLRFIGNEYDSLYAPLHSSWHVLAAISVYFGFRMFDSGGAWTFKPMEVGYDLASLDVPRIDDQEFAGIDRVFNIA